MSAPKRQKTSKNGSKRAKTKEIPMLITPEINSDDLQTMEQVLEEASELSSSMRARLVFQWMIAPLSVEEFYENYWEKQPLLIKRKCPAYYKGLFSLKDMQQIFRTHSLTFGEELDLTKFVDDTRYTLNPAGNATSKVIWKHYQDGCSVRMLCPQRYSDSVWHLLTTLEDEWHCMAGSNIYLTPKGTQGFAPHFDDIEAFLLQTEGKKHWKLYKPLNEDSVLPRVSSPNFKADEIGEPILEMDVEEGDLLYFPRGFIHQGNCVPETHSLHVTVSTAQQNSWANLLELIVPEALAVTANTDVNIRKSLPRNFINYMGAVHSDKEDNEDRKAFLKTYKEHLRTVLARAMNMIDGASDQMARNFLVDRLPPVLSEEEEATSSYGSPMPKLTVDSRVRLLRHAIARLAIEGGKAVVYHCMENSRKHHEVPLSPLEFELDDAESIECLLEIYPEYVRIGDLPHEDDDDKVELVKALYDEGILVFEQE